MDRSNRNLAGRVALVTGAGRGIGRAIAVALAERGGDVALHYHREALGATRVAEEIRSHGARAALIRADLADPAAPAEVVNAAVAAFGQIDLVVNNAGIYSTTPFDRLTVDEWDATFAINVRSMFFVSQAAAPHLRVRPLAAIVNLASDGGISPNPGFPVSAAYATSKAGVIMLTRLLALELAPSVRVNAVAPGIIESKGVPMKESARARFAGLSPLQTTGTPRDVANAVVYLASDAARFITGQILSVDGGLIVR